MIFPRKVNGFSLIELVITVAIFAIIASIAVPSYTQFVLKGNRIDAKEMLLEAAVAQERFFYNNPAVGYTNDPEVLGFVGGVSDEEHYTLAVGVVNDNVNGINSFTLTANAAGSQRGDTDCLTITLASTGRKTSAPEADCW